MFSATSVPARYDEDDEYVAGSILEHCVIEYAGHDYGLRAIGSVPHITDCHIHQCLGSGISLAPSTGQRVVVRDSTIESNGGEGVKLGRAGVITILNNDVNDNGGSGIECEEFYGDYGVDRLEFIDNRIARNIEAGIYMEVIENVCRIEGNTIQANGSGVGTGGGIIVVEFAEELVIASNRIVENSAENGGGVYIGSAGAPVDISHNEIAGNTADTYGGGLYVGRAYGEGEAVVTRNQFVENSAPHGAAIYCPKALHLSGNTILGNSADVDGATVELGAGALFNGNAVVENDGDALRMLSESGTTLDATDNWWGTSDESEVEELIYDFFDDGSLGVVSFRPCRTATPELPGGQWLSLPTPSHADGVIVPGSDIIDVAVAGDGQTIYAIGVSYDSRENEEAVWALESGPNDLATTYHHPELWKSEDGGATWTNCSSQLLDASNIPDLPDVENGSSPHNNWEDFAFFTAISVAPDDPDFVVVAGWGWDDDAVLGDNYIPVVVGSNDGAGKFYYMGCGTVQGMITCVDVSMEVDDKHVIALGTWDWENESPSGPGGPTNNYDLNNAAIWRYEAGGYWSAYWTDTTAYDGWLGMDAIVDLEFSPNFDVDDTIIALCVGNVNDQYCDLPDDVDPGVNDSVPDYMGYMLQAGTWNSIDAWNGEAEFDSYPVVIKNDDYSIVSPLETALGVYALPTGWDNVGQLVRRAGDIDLPMDYMGDDNSERKVMVLVNGIEVNMVSAIDEVIDDGGFMFWVENTTISLEMLDHEDNPFIASIDYHGNVDMEGRTLAGLAFPSSWRYQEILDWFTGVDPFPDIGCCNGVQVLRTETTGVCYPDWDWAAKPPTGQFMATVMMSPDGEWAFAGTMGESYMAWNGWWSDESAFSVSGHEDELGEAWNQSGLIDTDIDVVTDVAVSVSAQETIYIPEATCLYVATTNRDEVEKIGNCDSIWRSCDDGTSWLRIWNKELEGSPMDGTFEWMELGIAPGEGVTEDIYMADIGTETIWQSSGSGDASCSAGLGCWTDRNTGLDEITDFAVLDASTLYVVDFNGDMVKSTTSGRHWSPTEDTKVCDDEGEWAHDIICWGDWVIVGGTEGSVSYSQDDGNSFALLSSMTDLDAGPVQVAFDPYFANNRYVYAATGTEAGGVYRFDMTAGVTWQSTGAPARAYSGVCVEGDSDGCTSAETGGIVYAAFTSGVERKLGGRTNAAYDCLTNGLVLADGFGAGRETLDVSASQLWGFNSPTYDLDEGTGNLWVYRDPYATAAPELTSPQDDDTIPGNPTTFLNMAFKLEWAPLDDAATYQLQVASNDAFTAPILDVSMEGIEYLVPAGLLDLGIEFFWRVRALDADDGNEVIRSWWSPVRSFIVTIRMLTVSNGTGASHITQTSARLNGEVIDTGGETPSITVYWGTANGGIDPLAWQESHSLGQLIEGQFSLDVDGLSPGTPYFYRCYADNSSSSAWAASTTSFSTLPPAGDVSAVADYDVVVPGAMVAVTIHAGYIVDLNAAQYDLVFDPLVLQVVSVDDGVIEDTTVPGQWSMPSTGRCRVVNSLGTGTVSGSGYLSRIWFAAIGDAGTSTPVTFDAGILSGLEYEIETVWNSTSVAVDGVLGDVNGDGSIDALDMTAVARQVLLIDPSNSAADANGDGVVNVLDMTTIARMILGLET